MALIIVEGMDNTGKSTLIQTLAEEFRLPTARTYKKPDSSKEIHIWDAWCNSCPRPLILDRHPAISDLVYGPLLRGITYSGLGLAQNVREGNYLIYCRPSIDVINSSMGERDQLEGVPENAHKLLHAYDYLMEELHPDVIYDYTQTEEIDILKQVLTTFLGRL